MKELKYIINDIQSVNDIMREDIEKAGGIGILLYPKDYEQFKQFIEHIELGELPVNLYGVYPFLTEWNQHKNN